MRVLSFIFLALIVALQYPMWFGKGGWFQLREMNREIEAQKQVLASHKARNDALAAEVKNLKNEKGKLEAVEERARQELGLVKRNEVYFQLQEKK
jgi:cell division protein FtsB